MKAQFACMFFGAALAVLAQSSAEWTDGKFPSYIRRITQFGERADWSHDGKRILFLEKTYGDGFEVDLASGLIRGMTQHYMHEGYTRVLYLSNGDILLSGSKTFSPENFRDARHKTAELWVLSKKADRPPVALGEFCSEGPAVSRKNLKIAWGCERMGPLMNMIGGGWTTTFIGCFCPDCRRKARERDISVNRARRGYQELEKLFQAARRDERPTDGYFVSFWRLLLEYPEILGWEKLWTDSYHEIRSEIYGLAKAMAPEKPLGWHIMHNATLSPFYRAEEDYAETKRYSDFIKTVVYNNCGGPRMARFLDRLHGTIFRDARPRDFLPFYQRIMNYEEATSGPVRPLPRNIRPAS